MSHATLLLKTSVEAFFVPPLCPSTNISQIFQLESLPRQIRLLRHGLGNKEMLRQSQSRRANAAAVPSATGGGTRAFSEGTDRIASQPGPVGNLAEGVDPPEDHSVKKSHAVGAKLSWRRTPTEARPDSRPNSRPSNAQAGASLTGREREEEGRRIMQQLVSTHSPARILDIVDGSRNVMSDVSLCTAFHRLAKHSRHGDERSREKLRAHPSATWLAQQVESSLPVYSTQALANVAWAHAQLGHGSPTLLHNVAEAAIRRARAFNSLEVASMMQAYAKADCRHVVLLRALVEGRVLGNVDAFNDRQAPELFDAISRDMLGRMPESYAKAGHHAPALMDAICAAALASLSSFTPQDVSNLAWALAKQKSVGNRGLLQQLLQGMAHHSRPRLHTFPPQALSNTAWAYATLGHCHTGLLDAIAHQCLLRLPDFSPQAIANTAWALATLRHACAPLLEAVARHVLVRQRLPQFPVQSLACLAFAFATFGHPVPGLWQALADEVLVRLKSGELRRQSLVTAAWAFAVEGHYDEALTPLLMSELASHDDYSSHELCQLYQVELALRLEASALQQQPIKMRDAEAHAYFASLWRSGHIRQQAKTCWDYTNAADKRQVSGFQEQVLATLEQTQVTYVAEYKDGDYSIDIALFPDETGKIAVEADGPSHFAYNGDRAPLGPTKLKARLLQKQGWHVVQNATST
eukprot:jgi/Mesen1/4453/ME000227S03469